MRNDRALLILVVADFVLVLGTIAAEAALATALLPAPLLAEVVKPSLADLVRLPTATSPVPMAMSTG